MIRKTEAIVLNTRKFGDSSLIATTYTREFGRKSFIIKGYRSTRGKKRHSYFQPMSYIHIVFYDKDTRDLQYVSESSSLHFFKTLQTQPVKMALGLLAIEIFYYSVKEEEQNLPLFEILRDTLVRLDERPDRLIHLYLHFQLHLTSHLGFFPQNSVEDPAKPVFFDITNGIFRNSHQGGEADRVLLAFALSSREECVELEFSRELKREMLDMMMQFYRVHIEGFRDPESLKVFGEVFS